MMRSTLSLALLSHAAVAVVPAADFSGAECVVPPLSCFGSTPVAKLQLKSVVSDLSSITFNPDTETFFVLNNGDAKAFEVTMKDELINEWTLPSLDPEGIAWLGGRNFAVTDENPSAIMTVALTPGSNAATLIDTVSSGIEPKAKENLGFEGVTYVNGVGFLAAQEMTDSAVWKVEGVGSDPVNMYGDLGARNITMLGDIASSCQSTTEFFLLVKYPKAIHRIDLATGESMEQYAGVICDVAQPEGLTFYKDPASGNVRMVVVGEPTEVLIFEADPTCTDKLGSTAGDLFECPPPKVEAVACEKTVEDGGCRQRRCDKAATAHVKICTDTTPGVTDCSQEECHMLCANTTEIVCSHWAYDAAEKECYVFEGCENEQYDADYVQYAMVDPTCERTVEDYPMGCEQRRCDKATSTNIKICTDTVPGETDCTLAECKALCEEETSFTCTTYAYDVKEKECYIFETCENEAFDEDYSTYVLVDPTCDKGAEDGGCPNRICDEKINDVIKVCEGQASPATPCGPEACESYCEHARDDLAFVCSHFAFDPVDMDCHLFSGCRGEGFNDDFTTYVSNASQAPLEVDGADDGQNDVAYSGSESAAGRDAFLSAATTLVTVILAIGMAVVGV